MSTSKDEERFNKAIEIYIKKYQLTIYSLIKFIEEKIALTSELKNVVTSQILRYKTRESSITKEELKMYLHMVAAAQSKIDVRGKNIESFHQNFRLTFKESKGKEDGRSSEEVKVEGKVESKPEGRKESENRKHQEVRTEEEVKKEKIAKSEPVANSKSYPEPVKQVTMKKRESKAEMPLSPKKQLQIIQEDVIDENRVSNLTYNHQNTQEVLLKLPEAQVMSIKSKKSVQITGYDKFGQNFLKSIFKYHIIFEGKQVDRRYSEFQRLMNDLGRRYEGFILPELPPKQGLKSNLTYFSGVNEQFLNDRQHKLQEMLNCLVNSKSINKDQILEKFLTDQDFEIEGSNQGGFFEYFKWFIDLLSNTKEMKIYASAWFQFKKGFNRADISTSATLKYKEIQELLNFCLAIDHYRNAINGNFEKRRDVFKELNLDKNDRNLAITKFDHLSNSSASQIKNLRKEVEKYLDLKADESWLNYLIKEREGDSDSNIEQLKKGRDEFVGRVTTMERNLINSIEELKIEKLEYLETVGENMIQWRKLIHP